jgi:hypothetical protein
MRKGESNRTGRPNRSAAYAGRKFYAPSMLHRAERLEEAIADAIRETIELTRREIIAEMKSGVAM